METTDDKAEGGGKCWLWLCAAPRVLGERAVTSVTHQGHPNTDLPWMFYPPQGGEPTIPAPTLILLLFSVPGARFLPVKQQLDLGDSANM